MARLILGHTTESSIKVWTRASSRWPHVFARVINETTGKLIFEDDLATTTEDYHTGIFKVEGLKPETPYRVKIAFGKKASSNPEQRIRKAYTEGRFRTFPKASAKPGCTFLLGSCNLHSLGIFERPDQAWTQISRIAKDNNAQFMIHCGDQIYADIPLPPSIDLDHYRLKYLDAWSDCVPARRVLTELPHYMVLDDHEINDNFDNANKDSRGNAALSRVAMKVYWEFQHSHNPDTPASPYQYHYRFNHGTVQFFVMDTRYRRNSDRGEMIDEAQMKALLGWLKSNKRSLKFIVTSVPFIGQVKSPDRDKWCDPAYNRQRERILSYIVDNDVERVVFLTGDMHNAYHATMDVTKGNKSTKVHELMSSPINQITPACDIDDKYQSNCRHQIGALKVHSRIDKRSFYGDHSNVMAVEVTDANTVNFRIFRTTVDSIKPKKSGVITL